MSDEVHAQSQLWMGALIAATVLLSYALACGMPFAALGALAALTLPVRDALALVVLGWLANQVIGFGFLGYPLDAMTLAWGIALGLSALAAVVGARLATRQLRIANSLIRSATAFLTAWAAQQGVVFLASLVLGGTVSAFAASVVWFIFWTNALAFVVLLGIQGAGAKIGVARPLRSQAVG